MSLPQRGNSVTVSWPGQGHGLLHVLDSTWVCLGFSQILSKPWLFRGQLWGLSPSSKHMPVSPVETDQSMTGLNPVLLVGEILGDLGSINYVKCPSRLGAQCWGRWTGKQESTVSPSKWRPFLKKKKKKACGSQKPKWLSQTTACDIYNHLCSSLRKIKVGFFCCCFFFSPRLMAKISGQDLPNVWVGRE